MTITVTRVGAANQRNVDGGWDSVATGLIRDAHYVNGERTIRCEGTKTNFLLNSAAPVTQTPPNLAAGDYCLWIEGSGSVALSGGPTGTATAGNPVRFTLGGSTAVTFTKTGTVTKFQCEDGLDPTSFILTAGASVTRPDEQVETDMISLIQPMTVFLDCYELGRHGNLRPLVSIGSAADVAPYWRGNQGAVASGIQFNVSAREARVGTSNDIVDNGQQLVDYTQHVEVRWIFNATGSTGVAVTRNGGAESSLAMSNIFTLPTDWNTPTKLFLGRYGTLGGLDVAVVGLAIAQGIVSRDDMRTAIKPASVLQPIGPVTMAGIGGLAATISRRRSLVATMAGTGSLAAPIQKVVPVPQEFPYFDFLRIELPTNPAQFRVLNVVAGSWAEDAPFRMGKRERAFNGGFLSTQRTPKRQCRCTVDFRRPQDLDDFLDFIALDPAQPFLGAKSMLIRHPTGDYSQQGPLRTQGPLTVDIEVGRMSAREEQRRATGTPGQILAVTTWSVELTMAEV